MHLIILSLIIVTIFSACSTKPSTLKHSVSSCKNSIYSLKSVQCIDKNQLIKKLEPYQVIFIGDDHTSHKAHDFVRQTIIELSKKGYKIHLANEWFTPSDNQNLAFLAKREFNKEEFMKLTHWKKRMTLDFSLFSPIYQAVIENGGELYGINLSKSDIRKISSENIPSYLESFYKRLDTNTLIHKQLVYPHLHCFAQKKGESGQECLDRIYKAQVAWDSMMAGQSAYLSHKVLTSPKDKLIVFVGTMHLAYGLGVNMRFARMTAKPFVTILPQKRPIDDVATGYGDYLFLYE